MESVGGLVVAMSLVLAYVPIAKASTGVKAMFVDDLRSILNSLPADIIVLVLDDFNTQIGKRKTEDGVWREIRGLYSIGTCNEAGEQLKLCDKLSHVDVSCY